MIRRTIAELAMMCGGEPNAAAEAAGQRTVSGVATDSRGLTEGRLFVPLTGERFDGHEYVESCFERGAALALWTRDRPVPEPLAQRLLLFVRDTLEALQKLARANRLELQVKVVGITGSNGKTTTKDLTAAVLAAAYRVHKTEGNLNNHIGLPLTILRMDEDTECAVLEMGMSGFGEIELLAGIALPDIAVITNIGDAHLLQLGSREGIARAKLEIASGLRPGGTMLINGDEPLLTAGIRDAELAEGAGVQTFGLEEGHDWSAGSVAVGAKESAFTVQTGGTSARLGGAFKIPVPGRHNVSNALAAVAVGALLGLTDDEIRRGLSGARLTGMRIETAAAHNGATILNDAYNANPTAMRAAIALVGELTGFGRKWLVLADMLELGPEEERLHYDTGAAIAPETADRVLTHGTLARHIAEGASARLGAERVAHFDDKAELAAYLREQVAPDDLVLVKGSRGMRMEEIVQFLAR